MNQVHTYDPTNVTVIANGNIITHLAKSEFIRVSMANKQFAYEPGLQNGTRTFNPIRHATITITLMQGSLSNVVFENLLRADIANGTGAFLLLINDNNARAPALGDTDANSSVWVLKSPITWVTGHPEWSYSEGVATRSWELETGNVDYRPLAENRILSVASSDS